MRISSLKSVRQVRNFRKERGWTLVELVIAILVIAILLSLAYPAYNNQVIKARRADGHALLYEAAQRQQQFFTSNNQFTATVGVGGLEMDDGSSADDYYTLSLEVPETVPPGISYTLTATAVGSQANDKSCSELELNHLNVKYCTDSTADICDVDRCW